MFVFADGAAGRGHGGRAAAPAMPSMPAIFCASELISRFLGFGAILCGGQVVVGGGADERGRCVSRRSWSVCLSSCWFICCTYR
jgi:hypothetical protein